MKIRPKVKSAVKELGYTKLRKGQSKVIDRILDRKDTLLIAKTSFGKTLTAVIPAVIYRDRLTIIIEPLTVLMHEQVKMLNAVGINAAYLDSTQSDADKSAVYHKLEKQKSTVKSMARVIVASGAKDFSPVPLKISWEVAKSMASPAQWLSTTSVNSLVLSMILI